MINNFLESFHKSIATYNYDLKSLHWKNFLKKKYDNVNADKIINFRNNGLSDGMDNVRMDENVEFNNQTFQEFKKFLIKQDKKLDEFEKYFPKKNVGNCTNQIIYKNYFLDNILIRHLIMYLDISEFVLKKFNNINICEIGGGFGSLARIIMNNQKAKYFLIDLPEANLLSSYYLSEHFKNKKIFTYKDCVGDKITKKDVSNFDIIIIPPWVKFDDIEINLFINTKSMMEMNFSTIKDYFKIIQKNISSDGFFYNCNRYYKDTVGHAIELHKYPYDNLWKTIISKPAWNQRRLHIILTQRSLRKLDDIKNLKKEIKIISKKHTPHILQRIRKLIKIF